MRLPTIYCAGAIRDGHPEDIAWREEMIDSLHTLATILNPLGGKTHHPVTKEWRMSGIPSTTRAIVAHDLWMVDRADIVVANLKSLSEGYPSIGTLMELGRATKTGALIYLISEPGYAGHQNPGMFKLHPFLDALPAATFPSVDECVAFLESHLLVLSGQCPEFGGVL